MVDYREVAKTLRECVSTYKDIGSKYLTHFELAAALCERYAGRISTVPTDPEEIYCQQLLADLQREPAKAVERLMQARASAREEGREEGITAMREANQAAHERYLDALSDLQTKHDRLVQQIQQGASEPPTSLFQPRVRKWLGCTNPQHVLEGDTKCPECVWE